MGRKKWNRLSNEKKQELTDKIIAKMDELTKVKNDFEQEFDFFDAINNEIKDCFECNLDCSTCTNDDRAHCMQNFRVTSLYVLKKLKMYEMGMYKFMEGIESWCELFLKLLAKGINNKDSDISEEEIEEYEKIVKPPNNEREIDIKNPCLDFYT